MDIGEMITESLGSREMFSINILGCPIAVTDTVVTTWIIMAVLIIGALLLTRRMEKVPGKRQNVAEAIVSFINSLCRENIGHNWKPFAPYLGTVALFLVVSNTVSIFNVLPMYEIKPPTKDINVTACFALMSILVVIAGGIAVKGPAGWFKSFLHPVPALLPFKLLDYLIRPTSLCLRLFGNILGAYIVMTLVYLSIAPVLPGFLSFYFDIFDGVLQAYVFVFLSSFYIAESVE